MEVQPGITHWRAAWRRRAKASGRNPRPEVMHSAALRAGSPAGGEDGGEQRSPWQKQRERHGQGGGVGRSGEERRGRRRARGPREGANSGPAAAAGFPPGPHRGIIPLSRAGTGPGAAVGAPEGRVGGWKVKATPLECSELQGLGFVQV